MFNRIVIARAWDHPWSAFAFGFAFLSVVVVFAWAISQQRFDVIWRQQFAVAAAFGVVMAGVAFRADERRTSRLVLLCRGIYIPVVAVTFLFVLSDWLRVLVAHPFVTLVITYSVLMFVYLFVCGIIGLCSTARSRQRTKRQGSAESSNLIN